MSKKNQLCAAPSTVSKEEIFGHIDAYFAEDMADLNFEVPPAEIRAAVSSELAQLADLSKHTAHLLSTFRTIENTAADAYNEARKALETAQRKSGGEFIVKIERKALPTVAIKNPHKDFAKLLQILSAECNVYLVGPAGSGKSTAAKLCADALGLSFHFTGAVSSEFKLLGFIDAGGTYRTTEFRRAFENGGVFLFDEIDASSAQAVLCFNAALANGCMDFPDKTVKMHKDFRCIAAANTFGSGASRQYVGRNQLDAASLDRFVFLSWDYDGELEARIASAQSGLDAAAVASWVGRVQSIRAAVGKLALREVISPRASIFGAKLLASGMPVSEVETLTIWKGMDSATVQKIRAAVV